MAQLAFDKVVVRAGQRTILDRVSFTTGEGITMVAGPSGAGKSSVLRLMNRLDVPTSGTVRLDGTDLAEIDSQRVRRRVGMVFQRPLVFPGTVLANLTVAQPHLTTDEAAAALTGVGLPSDVLDRDASSLSGGEAQRLALARTLANHPEVLLADEVTASLDRASAAAIDRLLVGLAAGGTTVVAVTHDPAQTRSLADHVLVLVAGSILAQGTVAELDDHPDPVVRSAIGGTA